MLSYEVQNPNFPHFPRSDALGLYVANERGSFVLNSTVINGTTISAEYDPKVMTKDQVSCKIRLRNGQTRGVCHQSIFVGGEDFVF